MESLLIDREIEAPDNLENAPIAERLRYGSTLHQEILARIRSRLDLSHRSISTRYDDWDRTDEHINLYIDLSRKARKSDRTSDPNKKEMPFERAIVVPMAYAVLQVRLAAMIALFTARDPMIQLKGRGPEDVQPAKMIEALMAYDLDRMSAPLMMYGFLQDAEKYGLGIICDNWERKQGWKDRPLDIRQAFMLQSMGLPMPPQRTWQTVEEYFSADVIDPYEFRPDPRVPGWNVEAMEFIGHGTVKAYTQIMADAQEFGGPFINTEYLKMAMGRRRQHPRQRRFSDTSLSSFDLGETADDVDHGIYFLETLQVRLIPAEWKLGTERRPEIWQFVIAGDAVVLQAERRTNAHGRFGYSVAQTHYDPHAAFQPGMAENLDGIQRLANWLYSSHIENSRKILNDSLVYGTAFVEESDILNPGPARHIRLTRHGEELLERGMMSIPQMIQQLQVMDITQAHLGEIKQLYDMVQRMTGINDPVSGQPTDKQRTLGEIERMLVSSSRRLAVQSQLYDLQAIRPLAERMISDRQQYTSMEQFIRITGTMSQHMQSEYLMTNRQNIQGSFDYVPVSGTMPPDPERNAQTWINLFGMVAKAPPLQQPGPDGKVLDPRFIFKQIAEAMGVKNIEDAYINVMPNPQMQAMAQAGNAIPMGAAPPGGGRIPGAGIQGPMVPGGFPVG